MISAYFKYSFRFWNKNPVQKENEFLLTQEKAEAIIIPL